MSLEPHRCSVDVVPVGRRRAAPGHETGVRLSTGVFCQASAPALAAALACASFCFAISLGGMSIALTHFRSADSRWKPPIATPTRAIRPPTPISAAPDTSGPDLTCSPPLVLVVSVMAPTVSAREWPGHHLPGVIARAPLITPRE